MVPPLMVAKLMRQCALTPCASKGAAFLFYIQIQSCSQLFSIVPVFTVHSQDRALDLFRGHSSSFNVNTKPWPTAEYGEMNGGGDQLAKLFSCPFIHYLRDHHLTQPCCLSIEKDLSCLSSPYSWHNLRLSVYAVIFLPTNHFCFCLPNISKISDPKMAPFLIYHL